MAKFQEALEQAWRAASARHPAVQLTLADYAAWVEARGGAQAGYLEDLFLACAASRGDATALAAMEREHIRPAAEALSRAGLGGSDTDDVVQALRERLFLGTADRPPRLHDYAGTGPLKSWVRVVAQRLAVDARRGRPREIPAPLVDDVAAPGSPELEHVRRRYLPEIQAALRAALDGLPPDERLLLQRHFVDGLDATTIARLSQVHPTTVLRRLERIRMRLGRKARLALRKRLAVDAATAESVFRLLRSEIELGLTTALGPEKR